MMLEEEDDIRRMASPGRERSNTLCSTIGLLGLQYGIMLLRVITLLSGITGSLATVLCAVKQSLLYHRVIGLTIGDNVA